MNPLVNIHRLHEINLSQIKLSARHDPKHHQVIYINYFDTNRNILTKMVMQCDLIKLVRSNSPIIIDKDDCTKNGHMEDIIQIPIDPAQLNCSNLENFIKDIDQWAQSLETREKLFGPNSDLYTYESPLKSYEGTYIKDFIQMQFNIVELDHDNKWKNITKFVKKINNMKMSIDRSKIKSLTNELSIGTEIRFIFCLNKIWVNKNDHGNNFTYGIGLKVLAIEYEAQNYDNINIENIDFKD